MSMQAVGFDMDYTLSQYKPETFEKLAHDLTVEKLVGVFGYPEVNDCQSKLILLTVVAHPCTVNEPEPHVTVDHKKMRATAAGYAVR